MANRCHGDLAIVENDMALIAQAQIAIDDLEGLMLKLSQRPVATLPDLERMWTDLSAVRLGLTAVKKYLAERRE